MNYDSSPEENMMQVVLLKSISEGIMIDQNSDGFYQTCRLDELKIPSLEVFPASMKPVKFELKSKTTSSKDDIIMVRFEEEFHWTKLGNFKKVNSNSIIQVQGLPINMHKHLDRNQYRSRIRITEYGNGYEVLFKKR